MARFYAHYLHQIWPLLLVMAVVGLLVALVEVAMFDFLGRLIDMTTTAPAADFFSVHGRELLFMVFVALVKGLAALIGSEVLAALIVGTPFAAVALILTVMGTRRMARSNLLPRRFERQVGKDAALVANQVAD